MHDIFFVAFTTLTIEIIRKIKARIALTKLILALSKILSSMPPPMAPKNTNMTMANKETPLFF
jgi:hypothetical protein